MNIVSRLLSVRLWNVCDVRRRTIILLLSVFSLGHIGSVFAVDPPENIRLEDNVLRWDSVENAVNYNVYFLSGPVVDNSVSPLYAATIDSVLEFRPILDGFYTVVTVAVGDNGLEFSDVADGQTVAFTGSGEGPQIVKLTAPWRFAQYVAIMLSRVALAKASVLWHPESILQVVLVGQMPVSCCTSELGSTDLSVSVRTIPPLSK